MGQKLSTSTPKGERFGASKRLVDCATENPDPVRPPTSTADKKAATTARNCTPSAMPARKAARRALATRKRIFDREAQTAAAFLGKALRERRQQNGITIPQLAEMSGLSRSVISKAERGNNPTAKTLFRLSWAMFEPLADLFFLAHVLEQEATP